MKKNTKTILGIMASILCLGAVGTSVYFIFKDNENIVAPETEYNLVINYYKDDFIDQSLTKVVKVKANESVDLTNYRIELNGFRFVSINNINWVLEMNQDYEINFYYSKIDDSGNSNDSETAIMNISIYTSTTGLDGEYSLAKNIELDGIDKLSLSVSGLYKKVLDVETSLSSYNLNFKNSWIDGYNSSLYLWNNNDLGGDIEEPEEPTYYSINVSLYIFPLESDKYIPGQFYKYINGSSSTTLNDIYSYVCSTDNTVERGWKIDYELSLLNGTNCELYIYEPGSDPDTPTDKEYNIYERILCHSCGRELTWSDVGNIAICTNIQCGGDGYYKKIKVYEDPDTLAIEKQVTLVDKASINYLTKEDFN